MKENVFDLLDTFCNNEMADFMDHKLYYMLQSMTNELGYRLICKYGYGKEKRDSRNVYLSISVNDHNNVPIQIYDEGDLSASTELIKIDKRERVSFFAWNDEDFVDSIHWMIRMLREIKLSENN